MAGLIQRRNFVESYTFSLTRVKIVRTASQRKACLHTLAGKLPPTHPIASHNRKQQSTSNLFYPSRNCRFMLFPGLCWEFQLVLGECMPSREASRSTLIQLCNPNLFRRPKAIAPMQSNSKISPFSHSTLFFTVLI